MLIFSFCFMLSGSPIEIFVSPVAKFFHQFYHFYSFVGGVSGSTITSTNNGTRLNKMNLLMGYLCAFIETRDISYFYVNEWRPTMSLKRDITSWRLKRTQALPNRPVINSGSLFQISRMSNQPIVMFQLSIPWRLTTNLKRNPLFRPYRQKVVFSIRHGDQRETEKKKKKQDGEEEVRQKRKPKRELWRGKNQKEKKKAKHMEWKWNEERLTGK